MINLSTYLNEIEYYIKNDNINNILNYNIKNILEYDVEYIELFIYNVIQIIEANDIIKQKTFKLDYFGPIIDLIIRLIKNKSSINLKIFNYSILRVITHYKKGTYFLDMIKDNIIKLNMKEYEYIYIINEACLKGSLPTFLFWLNLNKNNDFSIYLLNSITNSDDRILKYILKKTKLSLTPDLSIFNNLQVNDDYIIILLTKLFSAIHIPQKYKLKRIKLLSFHIDLKNFFNSMILICNDIQLILKLSKFYYFTEINFNILLNFFSKFNHYLNYLIDFYNILKTDQERNTFVLLLNVNTTNYNYDLHFINYNKYINLFPLNVETILIENYEIFLNTIYHYSLFELNNISNKVLQFYIKNKLINKYLDNIHNKSYVYKYLFYTKYYYNKDYGNCNLLINKILSRLRCLCKKKNRLKLIKKKILLNPIINEINNYKPNKILKNGSMIFQLNKHKFNFIPPRHLLPYEKLTNDYLIKEKADGILVNTLPISIFPLNEDILNKQIKAEYIEELDLYLIFDINIPNTTVFERQLFLRNIHSNNYNEKVITNMNDLIIEINKERNNLINFLESNKQHKLKWYPKMFWKININKLYPDLIQFSEEYDLELNNNIINVNNLYKNDGFILTPLDGSREIKIKPKSLMTIDLLCENNLEEFANCKLNKIYRCYPNSESKFIPKEIRFDKSKPNSKEIIDCIKNIYNHKSCEQESIVSRLNYYKKPIKIVDTDLIKLLENQRKIFIDILIILKPDYNKNWLDLGCGQCKFYEEIKNKYLPNKYIGLDNDLNVLSKTLKYVNEKENIFYPCPVDLGKDWLDFKIKWYNFDHISFDYIFANYSLSHFFSKDFFHQLNKYSKKNTKFLFNLVKPNSEWLYKGNYLQSDDKEAIINFNWISYSNSEKIYIDLIPEYCKQFGWEILNKFTKDENNLVKCYYWYLLVKL
jgi:hypothetical protein